MKIFFTSDQHFYHRNIIKYASRPFSLDNNGVLKCAETIFNNYNKVVSDEDIVFFLGDVFLTSERSWKAGLETVFMELFSTKFNVISELGKGTKLEIYKEWE